MKMEELNDFHCPIFIIGNPRSGTTLLRLMISSHPEIIVPPECGFAIWWHVKYSFWTAVSAIGDQAEEFIRDLAKSKKIETWGLDFETLLKEIHEKRPPNYEGLVSLVYASYARRQKPDFKRWGDKNNFHVRHISELHEIFPSAQFIHIVRDGRDVACSYRQLSQTKIDSVYAPTLPTDIEAIAAEWKANIEAVRNDFIKLPAIQHTEIRYEDLVSDPEDSLRKICYFLGETYDERILDYHRLNRRDALEPREFLQWKAKTLEAPDATALGKYRSELSEEEIKTFEKVAGDLLRAYHYN